MGSSGSGKSTYANRLAAQLKLPVLHIDMISHDDDWNRIESHVVLQHILHFIKQPAWVIDGHYPKYCFTERLEAADTIVYFDLPSLVSLYRCLRRKQRTEKGLEPRYGAKDSQKTALRWRFIHYLLWRYPRKVRNPSLKFLQLRYPEKLVLLKNQREIDQYFVGTFGIT